MANTTSRTSNLTWLLNDLVKRVPSIERAIVLSADGLLMAGSSGIEREDAEYLSAVAAGFQSLARSGGRQLKTGPLRQTIVEFESAFLFVTAAGKGACLAVQAEPGCDIGVVAYEMAMLVIRVGEHLTSPARTDVAGDGPG